MQENISITNGNRYDRIDKCNFLVVPRHPVPETSYLDVRKLTLSDIGLAENDDSDILEILKKASGHKE